MKTKTPTKAPSPKQQGPNKAKDVKPTGDVQPVKSPRVWAGPCPRAKSHQATRVYRTKGMTRYCVCDDCGHTWKQIGEKAEAAAAD